MTKRKSNRHKSTGPVMVALAGTGLFVLVIGLLLRGRDIPLLDPKGVIADEQYRLLITSSAIMLAFAAVVLFFIYFFAWKYRETNEKTVHNPRAGRGKLLLFTAWASPIVICVILAAIMLPATQKLEPQQSIESDKEELTIRVVALRWKWLFMYPEQDIATVNYVQIPVDTPVRFELTADEAPMQSFWIPHLGGMLYAMTEHVNPLNLMAHTVGDYEGGAAEVNGHGFAGMRFTTRVSTQADFDAWVASTAASTSVLDEAEYSSLLTPTEYDQSVAYTSPQNEELFQALLQKYAGSHNHYAAPEPATAGHGEHH